MTDDLEPLDRHFAAELLAHEPAPSDSLRRAAEAVSAWRRLGHTCVPLSALEGVSPTELRTARCVGQPGEFTPLILDARDRLYLRRYHEYEKQLSDAVRRRVAGSVASDPQLLEAGLSRFFGGDLNSDQARAARTAVERAFSIITGGPGTGKTHTIAVVLALLYEQFGSRPPRIALAAPTGKAAARMTESIRRVIEKNAAFQSLAAVLPSEAATIHRLLGSIPASPYFRHDAAHPLPVDVAVIDEASMVDLALMAKLVSAIPADARLILLGDKDQLAAVEAGSVLGDLCERHDAAGAPLGNHIIELRRNYRFESESGIHRLSQQINAGDVKAALTMLSEGAPDLNSCALPAAAQLRSALRERVIDGFRPVLESAEPAEALARLNDFRILCALRVGPFGVIAANQFAESILAEAGFIDPSQHFYCGRPIIVTHNDYTLGLFNGDTGLILPDATGKLRAWFPQGGGDVRGLDPARLPEHETVFAMTVHKSQGSEFRRVLMLLPDRSSPVLTRELIYTGITRAREAVELWFAEGILREAISLRVERTGGLADALWT